MTHEELQLVVNAVTTEAVCQSPLNTGDKEVMAVLSIVASHYWNKK